MGNVEMAKDGPTERGPLRKTLDKVFFGFSFITLPLGVGIAASSLLAAQWGTAAIASGTAFLDFTQIKEHNRQPEKQSWYNPERIMDRLIGSLRFNKTNRMALTEPVTAAKDSNLAYFPTATQESNLRQFPTRQSFSQDIAA